jgi:hypothetical protein
MTERFIPALSLWVMRAVILNILLTKCGTVPLHGPNVVVEWLTLLLRIREIPGSNLSSETLS